MLQPRMESVVNSLNGAGRHARSGERTTWRNGYRDRSPDTRLGTANLRGPKLRQGGNIPGFLEAGKASRRALAAVDHVAWLPGFATGTGSAVPRSMPGRRSLAAWSRQRRSG
ncbi:MAG: transposase [Albidovulum sp.]